MTVIKPNLQEKAGRCYLQDLWINSINCREDHLKKAHLKQVAEYRPSVPLLHTLILINLNMIMKKQLTAANTFRIFQRSKATKKKNKKNEKAYSLV